MKGLQWLRVGNAVGRYRPYPLDLQLISRLLKSPRRTLYISCIVASLTGVAIMVFGAPPIILVLVTYGGAAILSEVNARAQRRLDSE